MYTATAEFPLVVTTITWSLWMRAKFPFPIHAYDDTDRSTAKRRLDIVIVRIQEQSIHLCLIFLLRSSGVKCQKDNTRPQGMTTAITSLFFISQSWGVQSPSTFLGIS